MNEWFETFVALSLNDFVRADEIEMMLYLTTW